MFSSSFKLNLDNLLNQVFQCCYHSISNKYCQNVYYFQKPPFYFFSELNAIKYSSPYSSHNLIYFFKPVNAGDIERILSAYDKTLQGILPTKQPILLFL